MYVEKWTKEIVLLTSQKSIKRHTLKALFKNTSPAVNNQQKDVVWSEQFGLNEIRRVFFFWVKCDIKDTFEQI